MKRTRTFLGLAVAIAGLAPTAIGRADAPRKRDSCPPAIELPLRWPADWARLEREAVDAINRRRSEGATCRGKRRGAVRRLRTTVDFGDR
jgi:hypothetical protein